MFLAKRLWIAAGLACAIALGASVAKAEWKPSKPITLLVAYQPGGSADTMARAMAKQIEADTGWTVVVDNKAGGGGAVLANTIMREKPDGHVFGMLVTGAISATKRLRKSTSFDVEDFDYLGTASKVQFGIVAPKEAPYDDIASMAEYARKQGSLTIASMGPEVNIIADLMSKRLDINLKVVPAQGGNGVRTLVLANHVGAGFSGGYHPKDVSSGQMKLLATLNTERLVSSPNTPTLAEQGVDTALDLYFQFIAPKGLPKETRAALAAAIDKALKSEVLADLITHKMEMQAINLGPEGTAAATDKARSRTVELLRQLQ